MDLTAEMQIDANSEASLSIEERRLARQSREWESTRDISKRIQREVRAVARAKRRSRIDCILKEFRGLRYITGIKANNKKTMFASMLDRDGKVCTDREDIANVFADFYEDLYKRREHVQTIRANNTEHTAEVVEPISVNELRERLKTMAKKKAADTKGVVVELLKAGSTKLLESMAAVFNDILDPGADVPSVWKETTLKVLFKKGTLERQRIIGRLPYYRFCIRCSARWSVPECSVP